jgi:D-alanyl-lipoteichoic acid acyltransferase DltB (MBOAT superfamily)
MVFQSTDYLVFLLAVFAVYWLAPRGVQRLVTLAFAVFMAWHGHRIPALAVAVVVLAETRWPMARPGNLMLLVASYFFYAYIHPWYALLIALTTTVDWACARGITRHPDRKKRFAALSLAVNFSILAVFKYFGFFMDNVLALANAAGWKLEGPHWQVLLPVGISFYTFQSASYVIDVYRGQTAARKNLFDYALFVSFFPQLVAGPIERAGHLLSQLEAERKFDASAIRSGLILILWGLLLKRVIADNCAVLANKVFALEQNAFPVLWAGVFAFGVQIYADFSAYTNIARGSARLLGMEICHNFRHPYLAASPADFWRRWHISLSTWFRDYIYIPLGGNRGSGARVTRNILLTFGLSGLWHGANWNFVFWGLFHGLLVAGWHFAETKSPALAQGGGKSGAFARWAATFLLVHVAWLMFREQNLAQLWRSLTLNPIAASPNMWRTGLYLAAQVFLFSLPLWLLPLAEKVFGEDWNRLPAPERWSRVFIDTAVAALFLIVILTLSSQVGSDFIYFQF